MKQKYFFPLNYNYSGKFLGIVEYKLLIPIALYGLIIFLVLRLLELTMLLKLIMFISFFLPITLILCSQVNSEPFYTFALAIIKYLIHRKIYLFKRVIWCGINLNCNTN